LNLELWKGERSSRSLFFEQLTAQRASREALHSQPEAQIAGER